MVKYNLNSAIPTLASRCVTWSANQGTRFSRECGVYVEAIDIKNK